MKWLADVEEVKQKTAEALKCINIFEHSKKRLEKCTALGRECHALKVTGI